MRNEPKQNDARRDLDRILESSKSSLVCMHVASKHLFSAREMSSTLQHRLAEGQNGIAIQSKSEGGEPNRYT